MGAENEQKFGAVNGCRNWWTPFFDMLLLSPNSARFQHFSAGKLHRGFQANRGLVSHHPETDVVQASDAT